MHRAYQPYTPVTNVFLKERWDDDVYKIHRKKVKAAEAGIDNCPPQVHMHLNIKLKKLQEEANRIAIIERDNRLLLEKMAHIMRSGGSVDHRNKDYVRGKSLNFTKRQRELLRVSHENRAILKRITLKEPHYNHRRWLAEWQVSQQYLRNISKYPPPRYYRMEKLPAIKRSGTTLTPREDTPPTHRSDGGSPSPRNGSPPSPTDGSPPSDR